MSTPPGAYADLRAVYVNCTLKRSPEISNTESLMQKSMDLMRDQGVAVDFVRFVDHDVATGVYPDMREHGWKTDAWPDEVWPLVRDADILVIGGPLWLGDNASVTRRLIERLYAMSGELNDRGQWIFYGKTGGAIITGNEDGVKHASASILYSLQHIGFTIPPEADAGWIGEIGPGPSYLDEGSGGPGNDFTNRHIAFLTWNLLHVARLLRDAGGFPVYGNQIGDWRKGEHFGLDDPNPEYR